MNWPWRRTNNPVISNGMIDIYTRVVLADHLDSLKEMNCGIGDGEKVRSVRAELVGFSNKYRHCGKKMIEANVYVTQNTIDIFTKVEEVQVNSRCVCTRCCRVRRLNVI